jgi:hypothetical protein
MVNVTFDRSKRRDPKARARHVRLSGAETRVSAGPWSRLTSHKTGLLQTFVPQADGSGPRRVLSDISCGQLPLGNPGVARMWSMLAVQAA